PTSPPQLHPLSLHDALPISDGKQRRPARARHDHGPGAGPLRRARIPHGAPRRPEARVADHPPLALSGLHRVLRERPGGGRRRQPGVRQRNRAQARDPMTQTTLRFPAEWEPQSAILLAWPHAGTDWAERLGEVEETYIALVAAITRFQRALVCVADDDVEAYARARLASARVDMDRVGFLPGEYDDTGLRDSAPITLREGDSFRLLDFRFTGWGGKFEASRD